MKYEYFPKQVLKDKTLTDATKIVACYLIHIAGWEEDNLLPSMNKLSDLVSVNKSKVSEAIHQLKEKEYIVVNEDNTFTFQINGIKFEKQDLSSPDICNMFGNFIKSPMDLLCNDLATPSTRIAAIMFFEWNFDINEEGKYFIKREKVQIDAVATYYGINKTTFRSRIQKAKESKLIDYKTTKVGKEITIIVNAKVKKLVRIWTTVDSLAAKESMKLAKKAREESIKEEKTSCEENNADVSEIEKLQQLQQELDYAAKPMSDRQIYTGCVLSSVKDRLQDMINMKGRDYAIDYMNEHWPKIDLNKVLD